MEAGAPAGRGRGLGHHQRRRAPGRQAGRVAPAGQLRVRPRPRRRRPTPATPTSRGSIRADAVLAARTTCTSASTASPSRPSSAGTPPATATSRSSCRSRRSWAPTRAPASPCSAAASASRPTAPTSGGRASPRATSRSAAPGSRTAPPTAPRSPSATNGRDYGTSNFQCNPSRIDGLSRHQQLAGRRRHLRPRLEPQPRGRQHPHLRQPGTLAGAINVGNGETPDAYVNDGVDLRRRASTRGAPARPSRRSRRDQRGHPVRSSTPTSTSTTTCSTTTPRSATRSSRARRRAPAAITVSAGADRYRIDHNWIAGNLSTGDGGGLQHLGLSFNGNISHNWVLFNQSTNPTLPTNGGGDRGRGRQPRPAAQRRRVRQHERPGLPAGARRGHRAGPGDRRQPHPRQQRRERLAAAACACSR